MTTTITSTDTTTITTQPRKICSPSFEPPQTMKTTEEMAHEYAEALDDIADLLDMPSGARMPWRPVAPPLPRWARAGRLPRCPQADRP